MRDPVLTADGTTYEREAIATWLEAHDTSPLTNLPLPHKRLMPNLALLAQIRTFMAHSPPEQAAAKPQAEGRGGERRDFSGTHLPKSTLIH